MMKYQAMYESVSEARLSLDAMHKVSKEQVLNI